MKRYWYRITIDGVSITYDNVDAESLSSANYKINSRYFSQGAKVQFSHTEDIVHD